MEIPHHVKGTEVGVFVMIAYYLSSLIVLTFLPFLQLATLTGHTYRVLYLAISPDGQVAGSSFLITVAFLLPIN